MLASTGAFTTAATIEPASATTIEKASGLNILPSTPSKRKIGMKTAMMISSANAIGRPTSFEASAITASLSRPAFSGRFRWRRMFSVTTMEPSTSIPSAIAMPPSDIRFAESPARFSPMIASDAQNGIDNATISDARKFHSSTASTASTSNIP